jgi:RNA polymerase sigma-70 factor (ECF subfamily)
VMSGQQRIEGYLARLFGYALSLTGVRDQARDLVQDCALRALSATHVPYDEAAYRAWLFGILRNLFIDQRRRAGRFVEEPVEAASIDGSEAWRGDESMVSTLTVKMCMPKLSSDHREIISLIDIAGFSYAEAAVLLDLPVGTVMSRVSRARQALLMLITASNVHALPIPKIREAK